MGSAILPMAEMLLTKPSPLRTRIRSRATNRFHETPVTSVRTIPTLPALSTRACRDAARSRAAPRLVACAAALIAAAPQTQAADTCRTQSRPQPPAVVELFTSEGCSSCPPADRWASRLKGRDDVLVLGFHVTYWNRLGWPDRFANAQTTERQYLLQRAMGAPYVYTPQVVANGKDLRAWSSSKLEPLPASPITVTLEREGNAVRASIGGAAPSQRLAGYWAVLEDGHSSRVKAGENAGETLAHDHVVTLYRPVAEWDATASPRSFTIDLPPATSASRRVAFIVTDAAGAKPMQAVALGC